jgi:hypothetical protein
MKRLVVAAIVSFTAAVLALAALNGPTAGASIPSYQDRIDAKRFARDWWAAGSWHIGDGVPNCGRVRFMWLSFPRSRLAFVPNRYDCVVVFNKGIQWGWVPETGSQVTDLGEQWWRFCATAIHEWGHLRGMPYNWRFPPIHSRNPDNIMAGDEGGLSVRAWWWPYFPGCRYDGDKVD